MTITSLNDVARWVCKEFATRAGKSKDKNLFVKIEEEAFVLWGNDFDYNNSHTFKSDLTKLINKNRKDSKNLQEEMEITKQLNRRTKPVIEGQSCFSFTFFQIQDLQLNADSY